jgi:hypothetical protein
MSDPLFIIGEATLRGPRQVVTGFLYQSGAAEAIDICSSGEMLQKLGLKAVLTVAHDIRIKVPANIIHLHLPVDEIHPTDPKYFNLACRLGTYPLLVHCMAGANRSRVFAAAIAYQALGTPLPKAIELADPPPSGIVFESMMKWARGG